MYIDNNGNAFSITAAADPTLATGSQYTLFTGTGAPWAGQNLIGTTFTTDRITVGSAGVYSISMWGTVIGFPSNTAKVAFRYRKNGTIISSQRIMTKSTATADVKQLAATGLVALAANDYLQLLVASDTSGNLVMSDVGFSVHFVG